MKEAGLISVSIMMLAFTMMPDKKIRIFLAGDSTIAVKETKVYPETGWGMPFEFFWDSTVVVMNRAKNGRSTKTFLSEGIWNSIYKEASEGDYVFIQFGHNDESKDKGERYATPDTFKINLTRFIGETRQKKATPVLLTPVSRRRFDKEGKAIETHGEYSALTHPNYPEGREDNTHFSELGARLIAQIVLKDIREQVPELYARVRVSGKM